MLKSEVKKAVKRVLDDHDIVDRDLAEDLVDALSQDVEVEDDEDEGLDVDEEFEADAD